MDEIASPETQHVYTAPGTDVSRIQWKFRLRFNFPGCAVPGHGDHGDGPLAIVGDLRDEFDIDERGHSIRQCDDDGFDDELSVRATINGVEIGLVVVVSENRPVRRDCFEALSMEMVCEFTSELVKAVERAVELIATVVRADETTAAKPLENAVDRAAAVVAPVGDFGDRVTGSTVAWTSSSMRRSTA